MEPSPSNASSGSGEAVWGRFPPCFSAGGFSAAVAWLGCALCSALVEGVVAVEGAASGAGVEGAVWLLTGGVVLVPAAVPVLLGAVCAAVPLSGVVVLAGGVVCPAVLELGGTAAPCDPVIPVEVLPVAAAPVELVAG